MQVCVTSQGGGEARGGEEPWGLECGREWEYGLRRGERWRVWEEDEGAEGGGV